MNTSMQLKRLEAKRFLAKMHLRDRGITEPHSVHNAPSDTTSIVRRIVRWRKELQSKQTVVA